MYRQYFNSLIFLDIFKQIVLFLYIYLQKYIIQYLINNSFSSSSFKFFYSLFVNEDIEESKVETEIEPPILSCIDKNSEPIVSIKLDETKDKIFNNLLNKYYNYEKRFFSKCIDNIYMTMKNL